MSDEALNAHLDWLDKCAKEQINECVKHEFMCATNEYLKCKYCPKTMHPDEAEAILNEHAALKRENERLLDGIRNARHCLTHGRNTIPTEGERFDIGVTYILLSKMLGE